MGTRATGLVAVTTNTNSAGTLPKVLDCLRLQEEQVGVVFCQETHAASGQQEASFHAMLRRADWKALHGPALATGAGGTSGGVAVAVRAGT